MDLPLYPGDLHGTFETRGERLLRTAWVVLPCVGFILSGIVPRARTLRARTPHCQPCVRRGTLQASSRA